MKHVNIPRVNSIVKFQSAEYTLVSCNLGGKCKIKKLNLPRKGRVLKEIDVNDLNFV